MADEFAGGDDEFFAEIGEIGDPRSGRPLSLPSMRPPPTRGAFRDPRVRDAMRTGAACALVLLTLLGLLSVVPAQLLPNPRGGKTAHHTAAAPHPPAAGAFYLVPGVPWGVVRLDGKPLSSAYTQDSGRPLALAPGRHTLAWTAQPFLPLRCIISVPADRGDTCPLWRSSDPSSEPYAVVTLHQSLDALAPDQRQALLAATQSALHASGATVTLHPGDHYYAATSGQGGEVLAAQQLLFGRVSYRLALDGTAPEPCDAAPAEQPCRFVGQDCLRYCTLPPTPLQAAGGRAWMAAVDVHAVWDYTTLDGTPVATQVPEPGPGASLLVLRITWSGSEWHVVPVLGHQAGTPVADDTTCISTREWLFTDPETNFFIPSGPFQAAYTSGSSPADGCVAVVSTPPGPHGAPSEAALYLERCGALVAVNAAAHALWPQLPLAGPTERALAHELAAPVRGPALGAISP